MSVALDILKHLHAGPTWPAAGVVPRQSVTPDSRWATSMVKLLAPGGLAVGAIHRLLARHGTGLVRSDIFLMAVPLERLVAALMWGYGTSDLRYPGRRVQVCQMLDDPGLTAQLGAADAGVMAGNAQLALGRVTGYKGVGVAYMTKYLYFTGKYLGIESYPLILDTKVSEALAGLTGHRFFVRLERPSYRPTNGQDYYQRYCEVMHRWSASLGAPADEIEYVLWKQGSTFWLTFESHHDLALP